MSKHTPGPWEAWNIEGRPGVGQTEFAAELFQGEPDPRFICSVGCTSPTNGWTDEDWANARLIAAAPDLLKACMELIGYLDEYCDEKRYQSSVVKSARLAVLNAVHE